METALKSIPLAKIFIDPDRTRPVDEDHALAIQSEIVANTFTDPILVRRTPRRKDQPYTLIDGGHRIRALQLLDEAEILAFVVDADKDAADMMEAGANLFRHLTALDRAIAIHTYRTAWERKHGPITRGGDQSEKISLCSIETVSEEAARGFSVQCAERLGLSKRSVELSVRIAKGLSPDLVAKLRGTAQADNQSLLLKLAELGADAQGEIVRQASDIETPIDIAIDRVLSGDREPAPSTQDKYYRTFASAFEALDKRNAIDRIKWAFEARPDVFEAALKQLGFERRADQ